MTSWIFYYRQVNAPKPEPVEVFKTKAQRKKEERKGIVEEVVQDEKVEIKVPSVFDLVIFRVPLFIVEKVKGVLGKNGAELKENKQD